MGLRVKAGGVGLDQLAAAAKFSPASYAGEESIAFPNGFVMKMGTVSSLAADGEHTVTFGTAFPTAAIGGFVCVVGSSDGKNMDPPYCQVSTTNIIVVNDSGATQNLYWLAIGY